AGTPLRRRARHRGLVRGPRRAGRGGPRGAVAAARRGRRRRAAVVVGDRRAAPRPRAADGRTGAGAAAGERLLTRAGWLPSPDDRRRSAPPRPAPDLVRVLRLQRSG